MTEQLYQSDEEIAHAIGIGKDDFKSIFIVWERAGLPLKDGLTGMRYWPAVKAFLDRRHNLDASSAGLTQQHGVRKWD